MNARILAPRARRFFVLMLAVLSFGAFGARSAAGQQAHRADFNAPVVLAMADLPEELPRPRADMIAGVRLPERAAPTAAAAPAEAAREAALLYQRDRALNALSRFREVKTVAWPSVREYIWNWSFAGQDVFAAYAYSQPGTERAGSVVFSLYIDQAAWARLDGAERDRILRTARSRFDDALYELGVDGELEFMLVSGMP